jgi:hypothetical protein
MITQVEHCESWIIVVGRQPGDDWPDIEIRPGRMMYPDTISATMHRNADRIVISVRGRTYRKNGTLGAATGYEPFGIDYPWVVALVREARIHQHLGPDQTGVTW